MMATDKTRDTLKTFFGFIVGAFLMLVGVLWTMNYDYVQKVDAKCIDLSKDKADKSEMKEVKEMILSMDKKFDMKFEKLNDKIDRLRK
jgi:non-homologous end joining protein Ku